MKKFIVAITEDIFGFFIEYSQEAGLAAFIFTICYVAWFIFYRKYSTNELRGIRSNIFWVFLLAFYLYMVLGITILSRTETPTRELSFELFRTFRKTFFARKQIYENIIMFIPFPMLVYRLMPIFRKWWTVLLLGAASSLLIETTQWITMTGCFEVDDIMTNTLGMMLGYVMSAVAERIRKRVRRKKRDSI